MYFALNVGHFLLSICEEFLKEHFCFFGLFKKAKYIDFLIKSGIKSVFVFLPNKVK